MAVIKVVAQTENGELLKETPNLYVLARLLSPALEEPTHCCLGFIDPYGDTVFNRLQLPVLLREWGRLEGLSSSETESEVLRAVQRLAERLEEPHRYLRSVGD